jgi:DHA2 family methylenomycin A resistance protein-like MFS transporter
VTTSAPALRLSLPERRTARPGLALLVAAIGFGTIMLHTTAVNLALPAIRRDIGGGLAGQQWCVDAYAIAFASLLLPAGALVDRAGGRRMFGCGLFLLGAAAALAAVSPTVGLLIASQALAGAGASLIAPASLSIVREAYEDAAARARAVALLSLGMAAGYGAGPVVGGALTELVGWRAFFLVELPLCALLAGAARVWVLAPDGGANRPLPELGGAALAVLALGALTFVPIEAGQSSWTSGPVLVAAIAAALLVALFVLSERRGTRPLLPRRLAHGQLPSAAAIGMLFNFAVYGELFLLSLFFQHELDLSPIAAGFLLLPQPLGTVLISPVVTRTLPRVGPRRPVLAAMLLSALAAVLMAFTSDSAVGIATVEVGLLVAGIAGGLVVPALHGVVVVGSPPDLVGTASAAFNAGRQAGGVLGVALLGGLPLHHAALVAAAVQLAAFAIAWSRMHPEDF